MTRHKRISNLLRQWLAAGVLTSILAVAGRGALATPPLLHPAEFSSWWSTNDPVVVALALLRVAGLTAGCYWLVLCTVTAVTRCTGSAAWLAHARLPGLRAVAKNAAGATAIGAAMTGVAGCGLVVAPGPVNHPTPPILVPIPAPAPAGNQPRHQPEPPAPVLMAPATTPPVAPVTTPPAAPEPATPAATPTPATPTLSSPAPVALAPSGATVPTEWVVKPGDDLWSIAESVLTARLGRRPGERAVAELWLRVIEANRAHLPDPANPNLIFAGDVVAIPG